MVLMLLQAQMVAGGVWYVGDGVCLRHEAVVACSEYFFCCCLRQRRKWRAAISSLLLLVLFAAEA